MHGASGQPAPRPSLEGAAVGPPRTAVGRDVFDSRELAQVMSAYDVGKILSIRTYPRGSRRSPKVRVRSTQGEYLLKRRAPGKDDPHRVALAHQAQIHLIEQGFHVAPLVGTKRDNNSMLQMGGRIYELFEFVQGTRFDRSTEQSRGSGTTLGRMHRLLSHMLVTYDPHAGSYHGDHDVDSACARVAGSIASRQPGVDRTMLARAVDSIRQGYARAARKVDQLGFRRWPRAVLHGDWHPGNLLYRGHDVAAVLDFDSIRLEPQVIDVANGLLQFSMRTADPDDPDTWPDDLDLPCVHAMLQGYHQGRLEALTPAEVSALPWLMIEALILEAVVPLAQTGDFAGLSGAKFLTMIDRKVRWIAANAQVITSQPAAPS